MWTLCRYLHILYSGKERKKYLTIVQLDETPVRIEEESQIRLPRANEADVNNGANNASTGANSFVIKNHRRSRLAALCFPCSIGVCKVTERWKSKKLAEPSALGYGTKLAARRR